MKTIDRIIMVGAHRLANLALTLTYDHFFQPGFRNSLIVSPVSKSIIWNLLEANGIDPAPYSYINDNDILDSVPDLKQWMPTSKDLSGRRAEIAWLDPAVSRMRTSARQIGLKLWLITTSDADYTLIHDVDTFLVRPYHMLENNVANLMVRNGNTNTYHGCLSETESRWVQSVLAQPLITDRNFLTEVFLTMRDNVQDLVQFVENTHGQSFFSAIWTLTQKNTINVGNEHVPVLLPIINEYPLLGHWMALQQQQGSLKTPYQYRKQYQFELTNIDDLEYLSTLARLPLRPDDASWYDYVRLASQPEQLCHHINVIMEHCQKMSMTIDLKTLRVQNLARYRHLVDNYISATS